MQSACAVTEVTFLIHDTFYVCISGCIVPQGSKEVTSAPILLLFHLEKVQLAQVLGSLLEHIEYRGSQHTFTLHGKIMTVGELKHTL